jgi:hypothetical protein
MEGFQKDRVRSIVPTAARQRRLTHGRSDAIAGSDQREGTASGDARAVGAVGDSSA